VRPITTRFPTGLKKNGAPRQGCANLTDSDRASTEKAATPAVPSKGTKSASKAITSARKASKKSAPAERQPPKLSSPSKVLFPEDKITKQQVWDYYEAVMPHLLPEVINRPLSIIRCPAGTGRPCFFQKHHTTGLELVDSVKLKEDSGINAHYLVVRDAASLLELVQFNALEFHPWGSHAEGPDRADRVVFDLDPGPDVPFEEVKKAATDIRKLLVQLELDSFLRVSGGKGLHVVVPLNPGCDWDLTKRFAKGFADALSQSEPRRFLATATKRLRNKRIFVDYLRNGRGARGDGRGLLFAARSPRCASRHADPVERAAQAQARRCLQLERRAREAQAPPQGPVGWH
jgi:bifunctional non-homologous end joining protein LigD